jgi:transcriptional regulator with XRE-family HTH domain
MIDFGKAMRTAQDEQGVSSVELTRRFGVHKQQVSRWRYQKDASLSLVNKMAEELGVDELEFLAKGLE